MMPIRNQAVWQLGALAILALLLEFATVPMSTPWWIWIRYPACLALLVAFGRCIWLMVDRPEAELNTRRRVGRCLECGYDLRMAATRCPECGTTLQPPSEQALSLIVLMKAFVLGPDRGLRLAKQIEACLLRDFPNRTEIRELLVALSTHNQNDAGDDAGREAIVNIVDRFIPVIEKLLKA